MSAMFNQFDRLMSAEELEQAMEKLDISKKTMAIALGVTVPAIDHWLMERRPIPLHAIKVVRYWLLRPEAVDDFLGLCPEIKDLAAN